MLFITCVRLSVSAGCPSHSGSLPRPVGSWSQSALAHDANCAPLFPALLSGRHTGKVEIGHGSIHTMETDKCYELGLSAENGLLNQHTTAAATGTFSGSQQDLRVPWLGFLLPNFWHSATGSEARCLRRLFSVLYALPLLAIFPSSLLLFLGFTSTCILCI